MRREYGPYVVQRPVTWCNGPYVVQRPYVVHAVQYSDILDILFPKVCHLFMSRMTYESESTIVPGVSITVRIVPHTPGWRVAGMGMEGRARVFIPYIRCRWV